MTFLASVSCANAYVNDGLVSFEAGYRHDNLNWSAKVPSDDPIFRSSSKFKDLDIFQIGLNARGNVGCNLYLRGSVDWGWVLDGDTEEKFEIFNSDSYSRDSFAIGGETLTTRNDNIVDGKYVFDVSGAIGYPFYFCGCSMSLAPVVGYSFSEQNLWVDTNENFSLETISGAFVPVANSECCRDKFVSRWYGPFVGLDWIYYPCGECWSIFAEIEYHWAHYQAKRHDRTGFSSFDDFKHTSHNAHGWVFEFGVDYEVCNCWTVGLSFKAQDWHASRSHRHHLSSEFSSAVSSDCSNRLRSQASWNSYAVNLRIGHDF
jgi:hypothetical protein